MEHIEQAQVDDVRNFFFKYYRPNNAILVVAGNVKSDKIFSLAEEWFGEIPPGSTLRKNIPVEPAQHEARSLTLNADVPLDAIYKAWHMPGRCQPGYYAVDLISDLLSGGKSGRLYQVLVKEKKLFSEVNCYQNGTIDPGLIIVEGKLIKGVKMEEAEKSIVQEMEKISSEKIEEKELTKVKNRVESQMEFSETEILHKAMNLAYTELLGDANLVNEEIKKYLAVTTQDIQAQSTDIFKPENSSTLYYFSRN